MALGCNPSAYCFEAICAISHDSHISHYNILGMNGHHSIVISCKCKKTEKPDGKDNTSNLHLSTMMDGLRV
jgi:hypothetical protein